MCPGRGYIDGAEKGKHGKIDRIEKEEIRINR